MDSGSLKKTPGVELEAGVAGRSAFKIKTAREHLENVNEVKPNDFITDRQM